MGKTMGKYREWERTMGKMKKNQQQGFKNKLTQDFESFESF